MRHFSLFNQLDRVPHRIITTRSNTKRSYMADSQTRDERLKRILELKSKSDKITKSLKIKGEKEAKKQNLILKNVMDDSDEKQRHELSAELNDKTKLNNIIRSMDSVNTNNPTKIKLAQSESDLKKQLEMEELKPYLKPELQFELDEDIKFKRQMELRIDKEINRGNFEKANELSDKLASALKEREINAAKERKEYAEKMKENEEKKQKKPKLQWAFETKQRWETKGNM